MEKLNFFGIGPKIGRIALPWLVITISLTIIFPAIFSFGQSLRQPLLIVGIVLLVVALIYYFTTLRLMLPGIRENRLITTGAYRLCRNPLYAAMILFLFPGLALVLNSWIILTTSIVGYLLFRKFVHEEEEALERIFGEEFKVYREKTSCFFPNPFK
jgi:protein-S-isoprenylcysteine O-methyltransferase Ste14